MGFSEYDRQRMLALKGVGGTVVSRLEQIGFSSLEQLTDQDAATLTRQIAQMMHTSCWQNSPQARTAVQAVINLAREQRQTITPPSVRKKSP